MNHNARTSKKRLSARSAGAAIPLLILIAQDAIAQTPLPAIAIGARGVRPARTTASGPTAPMTGQAPADSKKLVSPIIGVVPDSPATTYRVDQRGIQLATGAGGSNPIRAVGYLPSVDAPAIDPYGLVNLPGGLKGIRIRGEVSNHGNGISLVDGVPLNGVNPGPGTTFLIDNENLASIDLFQGPIPSNVNSYVTIPGVIDSRIRWGSDKFGGEISQSVGSSSFLRTFGRVDSGAFLNGTTKVFLSGSWTDAHQWRGPGKMPQGKSGFAIGIETKPSDYFDAKIFVAKSSYNGNTYAGLNYNQVLSLGSNRFYNFLPVSSRIPSLAVNYYNYNFQSFDSWTALGEFTVHFNDTTRLVVKPYYFREDGDYFDGLASGLVRNWQIHHDSYGVTSEIKTRLYETDIAVGHWYGVQNLPGPPTAWKMWAPNVLGGLTNPNWSILAQQKSAHINNSVYGIATRDFGPLHVTGGVRYNWETMAAIEQHNTAGLGLLPFETALSVSLPNVTRSVYSFTVGTFLPFGSLAYDVNKNLQLKVSAGGGYGGPTFDVWPAYQQATAIFQRNLLSANQVWRAIRPETAAMVDVSARYSFNEWIGSGFVQPTFYYSRNHNKGVAYDPGIGTSFGQNVGESENYGVQVLGQYTPLPGIDLFGSIGWQRAVFVQNLPTLATAPLATRINNQVAGRQLPDVPYWIGTAGSNVRFAEDFLFTPIIHVVSSRLGDTTGFQPIPGYATLDLNWGYERKVAFGTFNASFSVLNVFDTAYIGQISNSYFQQTSSSGIYFPGAPRTVVAKLGYKF